MKKVNLKFSFLVTAHHKLSQRWYFVLFCFFSQVKTQITEDFGTFSHDGFMVQVCAVLSIFSTMGSVFYKKKVPSQSKVGTNHREN